MYIYPNNKKTQDLLDDLDNKTIYRSDCSASEIAPSPQRTPE